MSTITSPSTSHHNFTSIFDAALESYRRKTKKDLASHPLLHRFQSCNSPEAVLSVLQEQITALDKTKDGFTKWVTPTVNVLLAFSDVLGQAVGLAFPLAPAHMIFAGISILLSAAKDAGAYQDKLIDAFNRTGRFIQRLGIYTSSTPPTAALMDMMVEIMVEVINILAIATKDSEVKSGRFKRYFRIFRLKLMRKTDLEDSLDKLDKLTQEEARMVSAETLGINHNIHGKVVAVGGGVDLVGDRAKVVKGKVQDLRGDVQDVGHKIQGVGRSMQAVRDDMKDVGSGLRTVGNYVNGISNEFRGVNDKLDRINREQLKDELLRWLSPPNPSVKHNNVWKARHSGTAQWFFQGSIFNDWKSAGSFLWVHGKPGSGKSVLCSSIIEDINTLHKAGTALMAYFYFDFKDIDKQNLRNLLQSLLIQLSSQSGPCCDVLLQLYFAHDRGERTLSDHDMAECLKKMLLLESEPPIYIIMDALDECPVTSTIPSPREEVLEFVEELVGLHLPNLHICVTSLPEHDIQAIFESLTERPVSLHDESGQQEDIAEYIASFVRSDQRMRRWREEDQDLVIETLSKKVDGRFRWAFCQLEVLRYCFPQNIRRTLDDLPESLDETYDSERILRRHASRSL